MKRKLISVLAALAMTTSLTVPALADQLSGDADTLQDNVGNSINLTVESGATWTINKCGVTVVDKGSKHVNLTDGVSGTISADSSLTLSKNDWSITQYGEYDNFTVGGTAPVNNTTQNMTLRPYKVTLTCTSDNDSAGLNQTTDSINIIITVKPAPADTTAPTLTCTLNPDTPNGSNGWYTSNVTVHFTATDNQGGLGINASTVPLDYTISDEGTHPSQIFRVEDNAGNSTTVTVPEIKIDKTAPSLEYSLSPAAPNGLNGWYTSDVTVSFTAGDDVSGLAKPAPGSYILSDGRYEAKDFIVQDNAGNSTTVTVPEIKIDKTAPTFNLNGFVNGGYYQKGTQLTWSSLDSVSGGDPTASGIIDTSTIGQHNVTITAKDLAGNTSDMTISYTVFDFSGILQPINPNYTSAFKQGSTIPVKFQLGDDASLANLTICRIAISSAGTIPSDAQINESVPVAGDANNDNTFRYDSTSKQYIYNLSTKTYAKGAHLRANVLLNGKIIGFTEFGLK